jgi:hypothetical protein
VSAHRIKPVKVYDSTGISGKQFPPQKRVGNIMALRRILWWLEPRWRVFRRDYRINRMGILLIPEGTAPRK